MLKTWTGKIYKVKRGQTLKGLAKELSTTEYALIACNGLQTEVYEGQILILPESRNIYTVQVGDTKSLLCGSEEGYQIQNGTTVFYLGMRVLL